MAIYGRKTTTSPASGTITNQARACVFQAMPENGWGYLWGMHAGRAGASTANVRGHIWRVASNVPGALLANTNPIAVTTAIGSGGDPNEISGATTAIFPLDSGSKYALGAVGRDGSLLHGMIASGLPVGADNKFYDRSVANLNPLDPMGSTSNFIAGWLTSWVEYVANVAPNTPTAMSPTGPITEAPTAFTGAFVDANRIVNGQTNPLEVLSQYRVQLRDVESGTLLWDSTYTASPSEKVNDAFTVGYLGSGTLDSGVDYEWRSSVSDHFGTWSSWSSWVAFSILADGVAHVADPPGVSGRQTTQRPQPFRVTYTHTENLSADQVQIQILPPTGFTPARDETIPGTFAPNATHEINLWPSGVTDLPWSSSYRWRARFMDTNGEWSAWCETVPFWTNYRPTVPGSLTPTGGTVVNGLPMLSFLMSDQDNDATDGLVGIVRIKDSGGVVLQTREASYISGAWRYQTLAEDLPATGNYRFDAMGTDGVLDSAWSAEADFFYAEAPTVITPAVNAVVATTSLAVSYAVTGQVRRHFLLYPRGEPTPVLNTSWATTSTSFSATLDMAPFAVNGALYDLVVEVELTGSVVSRSPRVPFELLLNAGQTVAIDEDSGPISVNGEPEDTAIRLVRGAVSGVTSGNFIAWRVKEGPADWLSRWNALVTNPPPDPSDALRAKARLASELSTVAESTAFGDTSMTYFEPRLGVAATYTMTVVVKTGLNTVESLPVNGILAVCDSVGIVLHDRLDPTGSRVWLELLDDASMEDNRNQALYETWSDGPPAIVESGLAYVVFSDRYNLLAESGTDPVVVWERLRSLRGFRSDDSPIVLCRRDDLGQRHTVRITGGLKAARKRLSRLSVDIELTEVSA